MATFGDTNPLIEDYLGRFEQLGPEDQAALLARLAVAAKEPERRKRSFEELYGIWAEEEQCDDVERMVQAIHEGRMLGIADYVAIFDRFTPLEREIVLARLNATAKEDSASRQERKPGKCTCRVVESSLIPGLMVTDWTKNEFFPLDEEYGERERDPLLDKICDGWDDDERTAEEIIHDIYESRVNSRDRGPL